MFGAIIGDIVGSPYEFANIRRKDFPLFGKGCSFTDDTVCTIAVADALIKARQDGRSVVPSRYFKGALMHWCRKYPNPQGGYGGSFLQWINSANPQPYDSFGNGAAMRVSPCGWSDPSWGICAANAYGSALVSHDHEEGLKGAMCVASCIWAARMKSKAEIRNIVEDYYGWDWRLNVPKRGVWDETCQGCVPLAVKLVLDADDFEDAIRSAVAYGGDSDTLAAIVGSIAEPVFGIPFYLKDKALSFLPLDMVAVIEKFMQTFNYYG